MLKKVLAAGAVVGVGFVGLKWWAASNLDMQAVSGRLLTLQFGRRVPAVACRVPLPPPSSVHVSCAPSRTSARGRLLVLAARQPGRGLRADREPRRHCNAAQEAGGGDHREQGGRLGGRILPLAHAR